MGRRALLAFGGLATVAAVAASADIPSGPAGIVGAAFASRQPHTDSFPPAEDDSIWSGPKGLATGRVQGSRIRGKIEDGWNTKKDSIWCSEYIKKGILRAIDANKTIGT